MYKIIKDGTTIGLTEFLTYIKQHDIPKGAFVMIKNHLSRILGERRWTRAKLARLTGIRPSTIGDLYNEMADRVSFDQLDRICEVLDCSISDLLEYIPNQQRRTGKDLILEEHGNRKRKQP